MKFLRQVPIFSLSILCFPHLKIFAETYSCTFIVDQNGSTARGNFDFDSTASLPLSGIRMGNFEFSVLSADIDDSSGKSKQALEIVISGMGFRSGTIVPKGTPWMYAVLEPFAQASCEAKN